MCEQSSSIMEPFILVVVYFMGVLMFCSVVSVGVLVSRKLEATNCFIVINTNSVRRFHSFCTFIEVIAFPEIYETELNTLYYIGKVRRKDVGYRSSCNIIWFHQSSVCIYTHIFLITVRASLSLIVWKWIQTNSERFKNGAQIFQLAFKTEIFILFCWLFGWWCCTRIPVACFILLCAWKSNFLSIVFDNNNKKQ